MPSKKWISEAALDFFETVFIGATVFVIVYLFVGQLLEVSGNSMYPTFKDREQIIAEKISIKYQDITRGEVVVFRNPREPAKLLIKRVIGLPGETIKVQNGFVFINGKQLDEPYLQPNVATAGKEVITEGVDYKIADESYVVMGDNRVESTDSRSFGAVTKDLIVGRGLLVYFPLKNFRIISQ